MQLYVGQSGFQGNLQRYASRLRMVELVAQPDRLPRIAKLHQWASCVPEGFAFSLAVPAEVSSLQEGAAAEAALRYAEKVFAALRAEWWVIRTPPNVTPSATNRQRLERLMEGFRQSGTRVAWEPAGVWELSSARSLASTLGVHVAVDLSREQPDNEPVVYTRLRALGAAATVGAAAAERLAERLRGAEQAYVVVEGGGAGRVAQVLKEELEGEPASSKEAD